MNKFLTVLMLIFSPSFYSLADTIQLKSGDTLTGKIKLIDGNKLLLETDFAGTITINTEKVQTFSMNNPVKVKQGLFTDSKEADSIVATDNNEIKLIKGSDSQVMPITDDLTVMRVQNKTLDLSEFIINGSLNAGAYYNRGSSTSEQYSLNGNLTARHDLWRHGFNAKMFRSKDDDTTSSYYYTTQYEVDRFFTPSFFWKSDIQYSHDWIEDIKTTRSIGTGPGWQVWDDELTSLSLATLISYQRIDYRDGNDSTHPLGSVRWNYNHFVLGKTLNFFTTGSVGRSFNDAVDLDLSATAGLAYRLNEWLSLNTSVTKAKSKTTDGDSSNTNYNIGLGVNW